LLGQSAHVHSFAAVLLAAIGVVFCNIHIFLFAIIPAVAFLEGNKQDCWFQQDGGDLAYCENNSSFGVRGVGRGLVTTTLF
jgi:hypothetical protein